jgi:hypothetical protein
MRIRLTKDVTVIDELTYEPCLTYKAGTEFMVSLETETTYWLEGGTGIWKTEAVKL